MTQPTRSRKDQLSKLQASQAEKQRKLADQQNQEKAALLDDSEALHALKLLDAQIEVKEGMVAEVETKLAETRKLYDRQVRAIETLKEKELELLGRKGALETDVKNLEARLSRARRAYEDLQKSIREQREYLKNQEAIVEETVNNWNDQLRDFAQAGKEAEERKTAVLTETLRLENDRQELDRLLNDAAERLEGLETAYTAKVEEYRANLEIAKQEAASVVQGREQRLLEIDQRVKARLAVVDT